MSRRIIGLTGLTLLLCLTACGTTPDSEAQQYDDLRDDPVYKVYQKASVKALQPVVSEYNRQLAKQNKPQTGETQVHSLLALLWMTGLQSKYALAEAEYAAGAASDAHDVYAALLLQSLALHGEGLPHLAKEKNLQAKSVLQSGRLRSEYNDALMLVHVAGSLVALKEGNIPYVANEIRELGAVSQQAWLTDLGDATDDVYNGARDRAIGRLERIKASSALSQDEQAGVDKVIQVVRAGGKDVASNTANAVVTNVLYLQLGKHPLTHKVIAAVPEKYREKLTRSLNL